MVIQAKLSFILCVQDQRANTRKDYFIVLNKAHLLSFFRRGASTYFSVILNLTIAHCAMLPGFKVFPLSVDFQLVEHYDSKTTD